MNKLLVTGLIFFVTSFIFAQGETEKEEQLTHEQLVAGNQDYFYVLEIELQENKERKVIQQGEYYYDPNDQYIKNKIPLQVQGIAFCKKNLIVTPIINTYPNQYVSITVITSDQKRLKARYYGQFIDYEADIFEVIDADIPTPSLSEYDIQKEKSYYSLKLAQQEEKYYFANSYHENITKVAFYKDNVFHGMTTPYFSLLLSDKAQPCGYSFASSFVEQGNLPCILAHNQDARFFTAQELAIKNVEKKIAEDLATTMYAVTIYFRQNPMDTESTYGYASYSQGRVSDTTLELKTSGCLLDTKGNILIATEIPRKQVERIQSIQVSSNDSTYAAEFTGLYKEVGAVLVHCPELANIEARINKEYFPKRRELVFTISPDKGDIANVKRTFARWQNYVRGYKNKKYTDIYGQSEAFDIFIVNSDNEVIGFITDYKKDEEDTLSSSSASYSYNEKHAFFFVDMKEIFEEPTEHFDPKAIPIAETKKTKVWLGVEVQAPQVPILEHLKATDITQYGKVGYIVNYIYESSPAKSIGLQPLDIIISVTPKDTGNEIFFTTDYYYGGYRYPDFNWTDLNFGNFFSSRKNQIMETLTKLGENREVTIKYFRKGKALFSDITLEKAPDDFESTKKVHIESLGVTVKDLTYEIKQVLKMPAAQKGVIVYKTSNGQPAMIAGLTTYEIITVVDGISVQDANHFQELVESAHNKGQKVVTILVNRLDKSRIAKLQFSE